MVRLKKKDNVERPLNVHFQSHMSKKVKGMIKIVGGFMYTMMDAKQ